MSLSYKVYFILFLYTNACSNSDQSRFTFGANWGQLREFANLVRIWCEFSANLVRVWSGLIRACFVYISCLA